MKKAAPKDGLEGSAWLRLGSVMGGSGGGLQSAIIRRRPAEAGLSAMEKACAAKVPYLSGPLFSSRCLSYLVADGELL